MFSTFDGRGMLQPDDHAMTLGDLRHSILVTGPPERPTWDRAWRAALVDNLEVLARQLWQVVVHEIFLGGSFVEAKDHPADIANDPPVSHPLCGHGDDIGPPDGRG